MNRRATVALLTLAACENVDTSRLEAASTGPQALKQELRVCGDSDGIIIGNSLSTDDLNFNALLTGRDANRELTRNPLSTDTFARVGVLHEAMFDPAARKVMKYLVGCSLCTGQSVSWGGIEFHGEAGVCPEWQSLAPGETLSAQCQQAVSSCMLGRNNSIGARVPLSVRGDDSLRGGDLSLRAAAQMSGWTYRPSTGDVASVNACDPASPEWGVGRDCGWKSEGVFRCTPGWPFTVAAGAPAEPSCSGTVYGSIVSGDMILRVCSGLSTCDASAALEDSEGLECPAYRYKPTISNICPASGLVTVMSAPYYSAYRGEVNLGVSGLWPASEMSLFTVREGAFFGTLFDPDALAYDVKWNPPTQSQKITPPKSSTSPKVVFNRMYACADERWVDGFAYLWGADRRGRVCALGYCATAWAGVCQREAACTPDDVSDRELRACRSPDGEVWPETMTTFLQRECDLTSKGDPKRCERQ